MSIMTNNSDERDKLKEEIKRLESVDTDIVKQRLPEVRLEEVKYTAPDDSVIGMTAQKDLDGYRTSGEKAIRDSSAANAKELADRRAAVVANKNADIRSLDNDYAAAVRATDSDAVKRGLARSSIAAVNRAELEKEYLGKNADIAQTYGKKLAELDSDIAATDGKLRAALDDFNLGYATKLNEKIAELKAERDKKIRDVTEYNNTVREKQAKLDAERLKTESALYTEAIKQEQAATSLDALSDENRDKIYRSVYDAMDKYLGSLTPDEAKLEILNYSFYAEHLSNYYYARLYEKYARGHGAGGYRDED